MWGEIGVVVEGYADDTYDVESVAQDGSAFALVTLQADHPQHCAKNQGMMPST